MSEAFYCKLQGGFFFTKIDDGKLYLRKQWFRCFRISLVASLVVKENNDGERVCLVKEVLTIVYPMITC